jgi:hypothetical protein
LGCTVVSTTTRSRSRVARRGFWCRVQNIFVDPKEEGSRGTLDRW